MGGGKRRKPRLFSFPFPSSPADFLFRSLQPSLRYKEASAEERGDQVSASKTGGRGKYKPRGILNFVSFKYQTFPRGQSWTSSGNWKCNKISQHDRGRQTSAQLSVRNDLLSINYKGLNNWRIHLRFMSSLPRISSCQDLWFQIQLL